MAAPAPAPAFGRRPAPPVPAALDTAAVYARLTADLASSETAAVEFSTWRRTQAPGRRLAWAASLGLMASGAICVVLSAPAAVSTALELAGLVGGAWLRRERKRHLAAIRSWDEGAA